MGVFHIITLNKIFDFIHLEAVTDRLGDLLQNSCSTWVLNLLTYVCFIKITGFRPADLLKLKFFTDIFQRWISLIPWRTATLKNIHFQEVSYKIDVPKIFPKFIGKHTCQSLAAALSLQLYKKERFFSYEFYEFFKKIIFTEHLRTSASAFLQSTFFEGFF